MDFLLETEENGTLLKTCSDRAKDWVVDTFRMMADPILDDIGLHYALKAIANDNLEVHDARTQPGA